MQYQRVLQSLYLLVYIFLFRIVSSKSIAKNLQPKQSKKKK